MEFLTWEGKRQGKIRLHNADGSIAEISGNGTRCVAAWIAYETKGRPGRRNRPRNRCRARVSAGSTTAPGQVFRITSSMGVPEIVACADLPLGGGERIEGAVVSTGNPHFVIFVDRPNFYDYPWESIGAEICTHLAFFPSRQMWNSCA